MEGGGVQISQMYIASKIHNKAAFQEVFGLKVRDLLTTLAGLLLAPYTLPDLGVHQGVLDGSKKLIRVKDLATLYEVPRFGNFSVSRLWEQIRNDSELMRYFPTSSKKYPTKLFSFFFWGWGHGPSLGEFIEAHRRSTSLGRSGGT